MNKKIIFWDRERMDWLNTYRTNILIQGEHDEIWKIRLSANPGAIRDSIDAEMIACGHKSERTIPEPKSQEALLTFVKNTTEVKAKLLYAQQLLDLAEEDVIIREVAKKVLTEEEVEGDSYGVPMLSDIVEKLVAKIQELRKPEI